MNNTVLNLSRYASKTINIMAELHKDTVDFQRIRELINSYQFEEAEFHINQLKHPLEVISCNSELLFIKGEYVTSVSLADKLLRESDKVKNQLFCLISHILAAHSYLMLGKYDLVNEKIGLGSMICKNMEKQDKDCFNEWYANLLNIQGQLETKFSNYDQALAYFHKSLSIKKQLENDLEISTLLIRIGDVLYSKGNLDEAIEYFYKSLLIRNKLSFKGNIAETYERLGDIYISIGQFDVAQEFLDKSLQFFQDLGIKVHTAWPLIFIGSIKLYRGELDEALPYFQQGLEIFREKRILHGVSVCLEFLSMLHLNRDEIELAEKYIIEDYAIKQELKNPLALSYTLFQLIVFYLERKNNKEADRYLSQLETINNTKTNEYIKLNAELACALVLKNKPRLVNKAIAQNKLRSIINKPIIDNEYYLVSLINLIDLLLDELRAFGEPLILEEIEEQIER
ncbi:MAG: tetratricopeptide repeat protein, partial [Candidatus Kariarchaeaceae archaeon]